MKENSNFARENHAKPIFLLRLVKSETTTSNLFMLLHSKAVLLLNFIRIYIKLEKKEQSTSVK